MYNTIFSMCLQYKQRKFRGYTDGPGVTLSRLKIVSAHSRDFSRELAET